MGRNKKDETITPSLRTVKWKWEQVKILHPKGVNKLFNIFIDEILAGTKK